MAFDELGKMLVTNDVRISPEVVRKRFRPFSITMVWGGLERKPYLSAQSRYNREKRLVVKLADNPNLNTPDLIGFDDQGLILQYQVLSLTDFINLFKDTSLHPDEKLDYFKKSLMGLQEIHNAGEYHGDSYLKNFFRIDNPPSKGQVYTCDFEFERKSPNPQMTDILMITANTINALSGAHMIKPQVVLDTVSEVYGSDLNFPFDQRDKAFFRLRFAVGPEFFNHFYNNRSFILT